MTLVEKDKKSSPEIYFKVITTITFPNEEVIYSFSSILKNTTLTVDLSAQEFIMSASKTAAIVSPKVDVLKGEEFKVENNTDLQYILKDSELKFSGDGNLIMTLLVPIEEVKYIKPYLSIYKTEKDRQPINLNIVPKLTCKDNKFVFSHELPAKENPKQPGGFRLNILV